MSWQRHRFLRTICAGIRVSLAGLALLLLSPGIMGCASSARVNPAEGSVDPLVEVPTDFELEVRVMVGRRVTDQTRLERRPAHMVLLPDGSLHAAAGHFVVEGARPGLARTLYRDQVADTWALLERLDFVGAGSAPVGPVRPPGAAEVVHVVEITADGERRRMVKRFVGTVEPGATTTLVRSVGGLAWLRDAPPAESIAAPLRYYFGPDPWARYRK